MLRTMKIQINYCDYNSLEESAVLILPKWFCGEGIQRGGEKYPSRFLHLLTVSVDRLFSHISKNSSLKSIPSGDAPQVGVAITPEGHPTAAVIPLTKPQLVPLQVRKYNIRIGCRKNQPTSALHYHNYYILDRKEKN